MLSTQKNFNQNSFDEGFRCDNLELGRLSIVDIFQDNRRQWSMLRCVILISVFILNVKESCSNETKSQ